MPASKAADDPPEPVVATQMTLKRIALRHRILSQEIGGTNTDLAYIVSTHASGVNGVASMIASQLLVILGDNRERMSSEAGYPPVTTNAASELLNILAGREYRCATVVTSQFDPEY